MSDSPHAFIHSVILEEIEMHLTRAAKLTEYLEAIVGRDVGLLYLDDTFGQRVGELAVEAAEAME